MRLSGDPDAAEGLAQETLVIMIGGALTIALIGLGLLHPAIRTLD